ncbi:MAG: hypothetical protein WAW31_14790 [Smithella sp.]
MDDAVSNISTLGFIFTAVMGLLLLFLPRRFAALPLIMTACYITLGQVVGIGPLHFYIIRIIILLGCLRVIIRKEFTTITFSSIDKIIILYVFTYAIIYYLLRKDTDAFISSLGFAYNALGLYFIFRSLVYDEGDYHLIFKMLAWVMVPLAISMVIEKTTQRNLFSIFGGVPEFTMVREGRLRCQGAFMHPILAGTFGASSIPFFIALWVRGAGHKLTAVMGILSATVIAVASASSGPVMVYGAVILGLFMWKLRDSMRMVRWVLLFMIVALHLVMKAPVWALIGKIGSVIGGTGWHRVALIDAAIAHFNEWWLLGTDYTRHWMPTGVTWSEKHTDITNYFIGIGVHGGLLSLILFVVLLVYCFKAIGTRLKEIDPVEFPKKFAVWCLGVSLFSHIAAFTSVSYFDQIIVFWYLLLAMIAGLAVSRSRRDNLPGNA